VSIHLRQNRLAPGDRPFQLYAALLLCATASGVPDIPKIGQIFK